ncbi:MAG: TRAP transporter small permease [Tepidimonas ignava]|uniref:TRAP transporter small permease n=1 Tax=Tepidimonas ignava TaxID=114249 RepID=UPI002A31D598|nr:TRAP transporter small permease [Tepidimonas ignava]
MQWLNRLEEWLIGTLMAGATLIVFVAVLHRYAAGWPIPGVQDWLLTLNLGWAQELTIIMFVWMAKFGAAYGVRTGIHVGVDVLINRLPPATRAKFIIIGLSGGALFTAVVAWLGATFVWDNGAHHFVAQQFGWPVDDIPEGPTTPDLEWPTWMVYSAIPLGTGLMCFRFVQVLVTFMRSGELPHHDHGHVDGLPDEAQAPPVDFNPFAADDDLHPRPPVDRLGSKDKQP